MTIVEVVCTITGSPIEQATCVCLYIYMCVWKFYSRQCLLLMLFLALVFLFSPCHEIYSGRIISGTFMMFRIIMILTNNNCHPYRTSHVYAITLTLTVDFPRGICSFGATSSSILRFIEKHHITQHCFIS